MPRELLLYLEDIRDAIASIRSYVGDRTFEEFVGSFEYTFSNILLLHTATIGNRDSLGSRGSHSRSIADAKIECTFS